MSWNYRVCREKYKQGEGSWLSIREVYYNEDRSIWAVSEDAMAVVSEIDEDTDESTAFRELKADLQRQQECTKKPIVDLDTLEFAEHCTENTIDIN